MVGLFIVNFLVLIYSQIVIIQKHEVSRPSPNEFPNGARK